MLEKDVNKQEQETLENKEQELKQAELEKVTGGEIESSNVVGFQCTL